MTNKEKNKELILMNEEQILIDEMNDFEEFMDTADVEKIAQEHNITITNEEIAQNVHNRICANFDKVERTLYEICVDLKKVRDNKYYKTLGYDTFEVYCLENFNMSRFNAYRYISIAENLSSEFVATSQQIGLNKMYVLSRLTGTERTELLESTDLENTSVKELERKSKEIKNRVVEVSESEEDILKVEDIPVVEVAEVIEEDTPNVEDKLQTIKDLCKELEFKSCNDDYRNPEFYTSEGIKVNNNLVDYYQTIVKLTNRVLKSNANACTKEGLLIDISDLIELSRRYMETLYQLSDYVYRLEVKK